MVLVVQYEFICQLLRCTCAFLLVFISKKSRASAVSVGWHRPSFQGLWLSANFTKAIGITNSFDLCSIAMCTFILFFDTHDNYTPSQSVIVSHHCSSAIQLLRMEQVILRGRHLQLITSAMFPLQLVLPISSNPLPNRVSTSQKYCMLHHALFVPTTLTRTPMWGCTVECIINSNVYDIILLKRVDLPCAMWLVLLHCCHYY